MFRKNSDQAPDLETQKHLISKMTLRVKKMRGKGTNKHLEADSHTIAKRLVEWWIDAFFGEGRTMFLLADIIRPFGLTVDSALWCISFIQEDFD